jgi:hypothetical protein
VEVYLHSSLRLNIVVLVELYFKHFGIESLLALTMKGIVF